MVHFHRNGMFVSFVVITALVFAALTPGVAFAEGEAPEVPLPPPAVAVEEPDTASIPDAVQVLAENNAVLVDSDSLVPLASQTALQILCDPDPWFYGACPGGKCTGYLTIQAALNDWGLNKGKGFIYVEGGYNQTQNLIINGSDHPEYLSLTGIVWDTKSNGLGMPVNNGYLRVYYLTKGFTVQGLKIIANIGGNGLYFLNNRGLIKLVDVDVVNNNETGDGIVIQNVGSVELLRVDSSGNKGFGARIYNCTLSGGLCPSTGSVKITNSSFNQNGQAAGLDINDSGLWIQSGGAVTLNAVTSHGNEGDGLYLGAFGPVVIKNSTFSGSMFSSTTTGGNGILMYGDSTGSIRLDNVVLYDNKRNGALLDTTNNITLKRVYVSKNDVYGIRITDGATTNPTGKNLAITDSVFSANGMNIYVIVLGAINLTNVSSTNSIDGNYLSNQYASKPTAISLKNVTVQGSLLNYGFRIYSLGNITLNGITATDSWSTNMLINNNLAGATGSVFILSSLGVNRFNYSTIGQGVEIHTNGNVSLSNVQADDNYAGVYITGGGVRSQIKLLDVSANNNKGWGVSVDTTGAITWVRGAANANGLTTASTGGANLTNTCSGGYYNIILKDVSFNGNINYPGLMINSRGSVTITNLVANDNPRGGVSITTQSSVNGKVTITRSLSYGLNTIDRNGSGSIPGLTILSKGAILINRLSASFTKAGTGAILDNCIFNGVHCNVPLLAPVTIINSVFNDNDAGGITYSGINIIASGTVKLTKISAINNGNRGTYIINNYAPPPTIVKINRPVVVANSLFNDNNGLEGLYIETDSAVSLNTITASDNGSNGVWIKNASAPVPSLVTVTGKNIFSNNANHGLYIWSIGNVTVSGSTVFNNSQIGIYVDTAGSVTMSSNTVMGNGVEGIVIFGRTKIVLKNLNVFTNGIPFNGSGLFIYGEFGTLSPKIYIYNSNLIGNGAYGININAEEPNDSYVYIFNTNLFGNLMGEKSIY